MEENLRQKNENTNQHQSEKASRLINRLTGLSKSIAENIMNSDFTEEIKNNLNKHGIKDSNDVLKKLVGVTVKKAVNRIKRKIILIPNIIAGIFTIIAVAATLVTGRNILIPIIASVILFLIIWLISSAIFNSITRKISRIVFKVVEGDV